MRKRWPLFFCRSGHLILETNEQSVESWYSQLAIIYANAINHAGTARDAFYKENLVKIITSPSTFLLVSTFTVRHSI